MSTGGNVVVERTKTENVTVQPGSSPVTVVQESPPVVLPIERPVISIVAVEPRGRAYNPVSGGGASFQTTFTATNQWVVNHNLGYYPAVQVLSLALSEMVAEVVHHSVNTLFVNFTEPTAGTVRCS